MSYRAIPPGGIAFRSAPPPIPPIYRPGTEKPKPQRNWLWILAAILIWAATHGHSDKPAQAPQPVEVRRALPVEVRRAQPVKRPAVRAIADTSTIENPGSDELIYDHHYTTTLLDKVTKVDTRYLGRFPSTGDLPASGNYIGDMFAVGEGSHVHLWIWMIPAGYTLPTWVDP